MPHIPRLLPPAPRNAPPLATLITLFDRASWRNNRNNLDRSACFEISATEAMTFFTPYPVENAVNGRGRLTTQVFPVGPFELESLMRKRKPRRLRGDYRPRAHAMQPDGRRPGSIWGYRPGEKRKPLNRLGRKIRPGEPPAPDERLPPNPNRGVTRQKVLGVPDDWIVNLRVETWQMGGVKAGDPRLPPHLAWRDIRAKRSFLICPNRRRLETGELRFDQAPPRSARPRGEMSKADVRAGRCYERARKLFMPLCTPDEYRDALAAYAWLRRVDALRTARFIPPVLSPLESFIIARYGPLFPPRVLLCAQCLGIHYGQLQTDKLPLRIQHLFPKGKQPELPNPLARNIKGNQFAHNQMRCTLTKSQLKNKHTRAKALAEWGVEPREFRGHTFRPAPARGFRKRAQRQRLNEQLQRDHQALADLMQKAAPPPPIPRGPRPPGP